MFSRRSLSGAIMIRSGRWSRRSETLSLERRLNREIVMAFDDITTRLREQFGSESFTTSEFRGNRRLHVQADRCHSVLAYLKDVLGFDMLFELTAADYLKYPDARDRFGVIYGVLSTITGERVFVKTLLNDPDPTIASCYDL